jgi:hypothetical protein
MKALRKLGLALSLAASGEVAAQPVTNPYFTPQTASRAPVGSALAQPLPAVIPAAAGNPFFPAQAVQRVAWVAPPSGDIHPYFGPIVPSQPPAISTPLPAVIPEGMDNPFFNTTSRRSIHPMQNLCEPANLQGVFRPFDPSAPGLGDKCSGPECDDPNHPSVKHPLLYKIQYGPDPREPNMWFSTEYLLWHPSGDRVISPVAASSNTTNIGALVADPRNQAVADYRVQRYGAASGLRLSGGWWGEERCCVSWGADFSAFMLERRADGFTLSSDGSGNPPILRPFIDVRTGQPSVSIVSFPGVAAGSLSIGSSTLVWGGEFNAVRRIHGETGAWHWDMLAGLRYLDLDENFAIVQNTALLGSGLAGFGGTTIRQPNGLRIADEIDTRSHFFGGQLGTRVGRRFHRLTVDVTTKVALGWSHMTANSAGSTTLLAPSQDGPTLAGGFLQVPTNSGQQKGDALAVVPEVGFQFGYDVTSWLRLTTGYSALYWSQVARPGAQVRWYGNPTQNPSSLEFGNATTDPVPAGELARTGLWLSGVTFGAMFKY